MIKISKYLFAVSIFCVLIFLPAPGDGQTSPKKYALLIGVDEYLNVTQGIVQLNFAKRDIEALGAELEKNGFIVRTLPNNRATRNEIIAEIYRLAYLVREDDFFLFYFSGHGVRNKIANSKTYLLAYEAQINCLDSGGIRLTHLLDFIRDIKAKCKLILLDHCYSGDIVADVVTSPLDAGAGIPSSATGTGSGNGSRNVITPLTTTPNEIPLAEIENQIRNSAQGMIAIAASRLEAMESDLFGHGVFTYALLQAMQGRDADKDNNAKLSIEELKNYLRDQVPLLAQRINPRFKQHITEATQGIDLTPLVLVEHLPINDNEVESKLTVYFERLNLWYLRNWVTHDSKLNCTVMLMKWRDTILSNAVVTDLEKRLIENIRTDLEDRVRPEEILGRDLNNACKQLP